MIIDGLYNDLLSSMQDECKIMIRLKPNISIVHDTRNKKSSVWPVKLRANFHVSKGGKLHWIDKYYPLDGQKYSHHSKKDFEAAESGKPKTLQQKELRAAMLEAEVKANKILDNNTFVSIETFERFFTFKGSLETVGDVFNIMIREALSIGSARSYRVARNTIARFVNPLIPEFKPGVKKIDWHCEVNIIFHEINGDWIKRYRDWMLKREKSKTTIAIHLRCLRAVFNKAIELNIAKQDIYPFGRRGFKITRTAARKIKLNEYEKIRLLGEKDPDLQFGIDYWALSYYCFGLNMLDIALLKFKNINDDMIEIQRAKTINTEQKGVMLAIPVRQEVRDIITRRGNKSLNPDDYVFPILRAGMTAKQVRARVDHFLYRVNRGLKKAGEKLGFKKLSHGIARHSFANIAIEKGASKEFVQDALGHATMQTTEEYLDSFAVKTKIAVSSTL